MDWFPKKKHSIDFLGMLTRREENPWVEALLLVVGAVVFGWVIYNMIFGD